MIPEASSCSVFRDNSPGTHSPACSPGQGRTDMQRANWEDQTLCLRAGLPPGRTSRGLGGTGERANSETMKSSEDQRRGTPLGKWNPLQGYRLMNCRAARRKRPTEATDCGASALRSAAGDGGARGGSCSEAIPGGGGSCRQPPREQLTRLGPGQQQLPSPHTKAERVKQAAFTAAAAGRVGSALPSPSYVLGASD